MELSLVMVNVLVLLVLFLSLGMTLVGMPGNVVLFFTVLGYAFYDGFLNFDWQVLAVVLGAIVAGEAVEFFMGAIWAHREKASKVAIGVTVFGTLVGAVAGTSLFPVVGSIIGAFLGGFISSLVAEYMMTKNKQQAWRVAVSVFKGQLLGVVVKFSVAMAAIVYLMGKMPWS